MSKILQNVFILLGILISGYLSIGLFTIGDTISMWYVTIPLAIICYFKRSSVLKFIRSLFN